MASKLIINIFRQYLRYYTCPLKPSAGLPSLMRLILLNTVDFEIYRLSIGFQVYWIYWWIRSPVSILQRGHITWHLFENGYINYFFKCAVLFVTQCFTQAWACVISWVFKWFLPCTRTVYVSCIHHASCSGGDHVWEWSEATDLAAVC
jgi:hypothetical protein